MSFCFSVQRGLLLLVPCILLGCSVLPSQQEEKQKELQEALTHPRLYRNKIDLNGRLSIRYENAGKEESLHGNFVWQQDMEKTHITLGSPFGQTVADIQIGPKGATLIQSNRPPANANDVDTLVGQTLGWPLPVSGLRNWLQGFGIDMNDEKFIATPQATNLITNDGWHIKYDNWQSDAMQVHPKRIDLERYTPQAGSVAIRIVIDTWQ